MKKFMFPRLTLFALVLIFLASCGDVEKPDEENTEEVFDPQLIRAKNDSMILHARYVIQTADLILRTGTDFSSEQVKGLSNKDKTYSHGGIAVVENGDIYVYHIEPDYEYIKDKVRKEKLDSFCNPAKNHRFGVARYNLTAEQKIRFINYLEEQYQNVIPFDMNFDLNTDDKLYCSEMIRKGLAQATENRILLNTVRLTDSSKFKLIKQYFKLEEKQIVNKDLVLVDLLYLNPNCNIVHRYEFEK